MTCFITKAPINSVDIKCLTKKLKSSRTLFDWLLRLYFTLITRGRTQTYAHIATDFPDKSTCLVLYVKIQQLTQHTIALSFEWINPLCYRPPSMNNTLTMWHFLIKCLILEIYDIENKGLDHF